MKSWRFSMETALRPSHCINISTNAMPPGGPVCQYWSILTEMMSPALEKGALSSALGSLQGEVDYVNFLIHISSWDISTLLKHSRHNSFLPSGGGT